MYPIFAAKALVIFFGMYYNDALPRPFRLLLFHAFIALFIELTGLWLTKVGIHNNTVLFNLFNLADAWLMSSVAHMMLAGAKYKQMVRYVMILISFFWAYRMYDQGTERYLNLYMAVYSAFLVVIYIQVLYDNSLFKKEYMYQQPVFLICVAMMIDYGCCIPVFGTLNHFIKTDMNVAQDLLYISHVANTVRYVLIAIGFYLYAHQANRGYVGQ